MFRKCIVAEYAAKRRVSKKTILELILFTLIGFTVVFLLSSLCGFAFIALDEFFLFTLLRTYGLMMVSCVHLPFTSILITDELELASAFCHISHLFQVVAFLSFLQLVAVVRIFLLEIIDVVKHFNCCESFKRNWVNVLSDEFESLF